MNFRKDIVHLLRHKAIHRAMTLGGRYFGLADSASLDRYQLDRLNAVWAEAVANVPFYSFWKEKHNLPDRINSFADYAQWPILKKTDLQAHADLLVRKTARRSNASVTGGSTGEPLHFRTFPEQSLRGSESMLMARAGVGFYPGDRVFLFWGHRHFYGHGYKSKIKFFMRRCRDWVNNTYRADACDLSPHYLAFVEKKMRSWNPEVIIAYSASLLVFCRNLHGKFRLPRLRCIICSAGPLTKSERDEISGVLGAPVYMEYGAMDAGLMAHMAQDGRYRVFQENRLLQTVNDGTGDLNLVTSLHEDYLPFFRYQIGDYLKDCTYTSDGRVLTIGEVWGRSHDELTLPGGKKVHAYVFMVLAEEVSKILAYQLVKKAESLELHLQVSSPLSEEELRRVMEKAYSLVNGLEKMEFKVMEKASLIKAPSGKIRLLIEE